MQVTEVVGVRLGVRRERTDDGRLVGDVGFAAAAALAVSTRSPNMSDLITETADRTKSHNTVKNASLISVSVSSDISAPPACESP